MRSIQASQDHKWVYRVLGVENDICGVQSRDLRSKSGSGKAARLTHWKPSRQCVDRPIRGGIFAIGWW
jgi:hypothetical protein